MTTKNYIYDYDDHNFYNYYQVGFQQGQEVSTTKWTQIYFSDFLSSMGGLFTSTVGVISFFISGYQAFVSDKSMIKKLYGEEDTTGEQEEEQKEAGKAPLVRSSSP